MIFNQILLVSTTGNVERTEWENILIDVKVLRVNCGLSHLV